jgi:hypothetical protein
MLTNKQANKLRGARTRRFITVFTRARYRPLSWASWIHFTLPQPVSLRSILIQSSRLFLGGPSGLFPSCFSTKILYTFLSAPMRATCLTHLILLDLMCLIILGMGTKYEAPHCATSSILLLLHPSLVQIFSLEPCSQTPSVCALPLTLYSRAVTIYTIGFYNQ